MQCPKCGVTVVATAYFCPVCGQVLAAPHPTPIAVGAAAIDANATTVSIHDAQTVVMQRVVAASAGDEPALSAAEVAAIVAGMGKSMVVSQWERWWWKILIIGIALYLVVNNVTFLTDNVFLLPQLFMIGTFLVPIVYTAYLYEDGTLYDVPLSKLALIFFFGGVIGSLTASVLEWQLTRADHGGLLGSLSLTNAAVVALSEELTKLIVVVPFLAVARRQYPTIMHGLVLGAAAGMGFAAFESMGYAFSALITGGGVEAMHNMIRLRALLAPLGHGTWTAIIAAAIWREWLTSRVPLNSNVLVAYLAAVLLHLLWDYVPSVGLGLIGVPLLHVLLGIVGLLILRFFIRVAKGSTGGAYGEANLLLALRMYFGGLRGEMRGKMRPQMNAKAQRRKGSETR